MSSDFSGKVRETRLDTLPTFRYSPLPSYHFRILKLYPGQPDTPLEISLKEKCLGILEFSFESLSYIWGNPKREVPIECKGAKLKITKSLHKALCRLRYQDRPRKLWVDAICINQKDFDERAQQVLIMKEIYPKADKVLVWLGEEDENDKLAVSAIDEWATFNRQYQRKNIATRFSEFKKRFTSTTNYIEKLGAVGKLTHRTWFNRCWTFQEILLSNNAELLVGKFGIEWDCFYHALEAFPLNLLSENVLNFNALFMCQGNAKIKNISSTGSDSYPVSRNLSKILQITRNFTATDPRDKIFSMLSISETRNPCMFVPDYRISTRETFISWTFAIILDENSLNVITNCGEKKRDKSLPSWCPDWACKRGVTLTGYYDYISYDINAGLKPCFASLEMKGRSEMDLEGALIDVVDKVYDLKALGDELEASAKDGSFINVLSKFVRKTSLQKCLLHDQLSPEAVLLRTLTADHWFFGAHLQGSYKEYWFPSHLKFGERKWNKRNGNTINPCSHLNVREVIPDRIQQNGVTGVNSDTGRKAERCDQKVERQFTHAVIAKIYRESSPFYEEGQDLHDAKDIDQITLLAIAKEAISQALFFFKGKKLLISREKFVAIGPENTKVGDSFCSFWGADVPFIIRKKKKFALGKRTSKFSNKGYDTVPDLYKIIGECYIDGIMYGELFQIVKETREKRSRSPRKRNENCAHKNLQPLVDWVQIKKFRIS